MLLLHCQRNSGGIRTAFIAADWSGTDGSGMSLWDLGRLTFRGRMRRIGQVLRSRRKIKAGQISDLCPAEQEGMDIKDAEGTGDRKKAVERPEKFPCRDIGGGIVQYACTKRVPCVLPTADPDRVPLRRLWHDAGCVLYPDGQIHKGDSA